MQTFISGVRTLYAAIETRRGDGATERFVLAYTWEQSLRELVAAPSIVASGCLTRENAEEICRGEKPGRRSLASSRVSGVRLQRSSSVCSALRCAFGDKNLLDNVPHLCRWMLTEEPLHVGVTS